MAKRTDAARPRAPKPARAADRLIEVSVQGKAWTGTMSGVRRLVTRAAGAALEAALPARSHRSRSAVEVGILLSTDAHVQRLNATFRNKDKPTNVLSFPSGQPSEPAARTRQASVPELLGGVVLAFQTCRREAREQGKPLQHHVAHLVIHGVLHLLGHDHIRPGEAARMERLERKILAGLGIVDPYLLPADAPVKKGLKRS